jgi:hypothetical protein
MRSHMCALDFLMEPPVNCPDTDVRDVTFVKAASTIGGPVPWKSTWPMANILFDRVWLQGGTWQRDHISKHIIPLSEFLTAWSEEESETQFLAKADVEAENVVGCYGCAEHEACIKLLPNRGHQNRVIEMAWIVYGLRPQPGTKASLEASKKRKVDAYGRAAGKRAKVATKKKSIPLKIGVLKGKSVPLRKHTSELERANAELKVELDQSLVKIAEMETRQDFSKSGYR